MRRLFLLSMLLLVAAACPTQKQASLCVFQKADQNNDQQLSTDEITTAIETFVPWYERMALNMIGGVNRIFKDCDANGDGVLTLPEIQSRPTTCFDTCKKRSMTMAILGCT